jgi:hypothetical protein
MWVLILGKTGGRETGENWGTENWGTDGENWGTDGKFTDELCLKLR